METPFKVFKESCGICGKLDASYKCPNCQLSYCSLTCYKSPIHENCTEAFYKKNIDEVLKSNSQQQSGKGMPDKKKFVKMLSAYGNGDHNEWRYEVPEVVKRTKEEIEMNFTLEDLKEGDEELTVNEEKELIELVQNASAERLFDLLTPEEKKKFEAYANRQYSSYNNESD